MSEKYLNLTGLGTLWAKVKARLATKQDAIPCVALKIGDDFTAIVHSKAVELGTSSLFYVSASNSDVAGGLTNGPPGVNNSFRAECFTFWNGVAGSSYKSTIVQVMAATNQKLLVGKIIQSSTYPVPTAIWTEKQNKLTKTDAEITAAVGKAHSHANKTVLDGITAEKVSAWDAKQDDLSDILPTDASATNQLATKAYADAIGERLEARYLGCDASGNPFATHAALASATAYYYQGASATPDTNDITTVTSDEDHVGDTGQPSTTRYRWNGTGWSFEYVINNTGLSESQLLAVNSGITAAKVSGYDGLGARISAEASARQTADAAKLNVDGTNADEPGVIEILKQVPSGTATLSDLDNFLGCGETETPGDAENQKTVRRPVTDIWNYVKGKVSAWFGTVGSSSTPVYFSSGTPTACGPNVTMTSSTSGTETGFTAARSDIQSAVTLYQDDTTHGLRDGSGSLIIRNADGNIQIGEATNLGNYYTPIFLKNGVPTEVIPANMSVGKATKLGSSSIGKNNRPIYLVAGEPTPCSATIGSSTSPVYLNNGEFTECDTWRMQLMEKVCGYYSASNETSLNRKGKYYMIAYATYKDTSKYADFGVVFKIRAIRSQNMYSGTINAGYRRNNAAIGSLAATIHWDGDTPNSTTCKFGIVISDSGTAYPTIYLYSYTNADYAGISAYFDGYLSYKPVSELGDNMTCILVQDPAVALGVTALPSGDTYKSVILNG